MTEPFAINGPTLISYGFTPHFAALAVLYPDHYPARVICQHRDLYTVMSENGPLLAEVSGKLRFAARGAADFPAVGDFVLLDRDMGGNGNAVIHQLLARNSVFLRKAAGDAHDTQVVAANIDTVFICMSLNNDFNLRRLERYLALAWDSGANPAVVLTKADLCEDTPALLRQVESVAIGVPVLVSSALGEDGYAQILPYIQPGKTIAFIGSSGVGKSTLINRLLGEERLATRGIGGDDKGRHTTTRRELLLLPGGGLVIDTPGMRELGLESADFNRGFADISELAGQCRFPDCRHENEPGCAVQEAIDAGLLEPERLASYQKLQKEAAYEGLNSRQIEHAKINAMFGGLGEMKNVRKMLKEKHKPQP